MNVDDFVRVKDDYPVKGLRGKIGRIRRVWPSLDRIAVTFPYPPSEFHFKKYEVELLERGLPEMREDLHLSPEQAPCIVCAIPTIRRIGEARTPCCSIHEKYLDDNGRLIQAASSAEA